MITAFFNAAFVLKFVGGLLRLCIDGLWRPVDVGSSGLSLVVSLNIYDLTQLTVAYKTSLLVSTVF